MKPTKIPRTKREVLRLAANLDGKRKGISQKKIDEAYKLVETLDIAAIIHREPSPLVMLRRKAKKKAAAVKNKIKKSKVKK